MGDPQKPAKPESEIGNTERGTDKAGRVTAATHRSIIKPKRERPAITARPKGDTTFTEAEAAEYGHLPTTKYPPGSNPEPIKTVVGKLAHVHAEEIIDADKLPRGLLGAKGEPIKLYVENTDSPIGTPQRFPDRVDLKNRIVYEIKPDTPHGRQAGPPQAKNYARILNESGGKETWRFEVAYYEPEKAIKILSEKYKLTEDEVKEFRAEVRKQQARDARKLQRAEKAKAAQEAKEEPGKTERGTAAKGKAEAETEAKAESKGTRPVDRGKKEAEPKPRTTRAVKGDPTDERAVKSRGLKRSAEPEAKQKGAPGKKGPRRRGPRPGMEGHALTGALIGTIVSALGILALQHFQESYLEDLAQLPLPPLDPRDTQSYISDPSTRAGIQVLDLLDRRWPQLGVDLTKASDEAFAETAALQHELFLADDRSVADRLPDIEQLIEQVGRIASNLETILANIDAILVLEPQLEETAKHAETLEEYVRTVGPAGIVLGVVTFTPDDLLQIANFFRKMHVGCRRLTIELRSLRRVVAPLVEEWQQTGTELSKAYFGLAIDAAVRDYESQGAPEVLIVPFSGVEDTRGLR